MFLLMFAAISGGLITFTVTLSYGIWLAALGASIGGSFSAAAAAVYIASRTSTDGLGKFNLDVQTDSMVAAIRGTAERGEVATDKATFMPEKRVA